MSRGLLLALLLGCTSAPPATHDDAGPDATAIDGGVSFRSMTMVTTLSEDCMPIVAADPLSIAGTIVVTNTSTAPLGATHVSEGRVVRLLGGDTIATFAVAPLELPTIAPGATVMAPFAKIAATPSGGAGLTGCDIVACNTAVRIELALTGAGVPDGAHAASEPLTISCAF